MKVNLKKSVLVPTQDIHHLGFQVDFKKARLNVPVQKIKNIRKELGKILTNSEMSCRKMAAILGQVRSFLMAMPFLRAFTDAMVHFVSSSRWRGWDQKQEVPEFLRQQVRDVNVLTKNWVGRPFLNNNKRRELHSDSSTLAWGGLDIGTGQFVQEFWREKSALHINVKELEAAIATVKSLAKKGETVVLSVDNSVAFSYLRKSGGRLQSFNAMMRPFLAWCLHREVILKVEWVPSEAMQADKLSRWTMDEGDYSLDPPLFRSILSSFREWASPEVEIFASPGNCKLKNFVSRWPHFQAVAVDALVCPLKNFQVVYANPPWQVILPWLQRLRQNPHLVCLMVVPLWVSAIWWPLLVKLHVSKTPCWVVEPFQGMFTDCQGTCMPPPRWPLLCLLLSGKSWRSNKSHLKLWRTTF